MVAPELNLEKYAALPFETEFPFYNNESEFSNFRKKLSAKIEKHLDIELPDNLIMAMTKMEDMVNLLASTNETLTVLEPEELGFDANHFAEKIDEGKFDLGDKIVGFFCSTPTDFFDILYNS